MRTDGIHHRAAAGHRLCAADAAANAGVYRRRADYARARHRRQQRDLQRGARRAAGVAAVPRCRPPAPGQDAVSGRHQVHGLSAPDFVSVREDTRVFEQVETYTTRLLTMLGAGEPREVEGASVSGGLFDLFGVPIALGRGFLPDENQPGRGGVLVLSDGFWQRVFGGDRNVLGRSVTIGGSAYVVAGVLAPAAGLPDRGRSVRAADLRRHVQRRDGDRAPLGVSRGVRARPAGRERGRHRGRPATHRHAAARDISQHQRRLDLHQRAARGNDRRRSAPAVADAARRRRPRAARRLRQCRQSSAGRADRRGTASSRCGPRLAPAGRDWYGS